MANLKPGVVRPDNPDLNSQAHCHAFSVPEAASALKMSPEAFRKLIDQLAGDRELFTFLCARVQATYAYGRHLEDDEPRDPARDSSTPADKIAELQRQLAEAQAKAA